MISHKWFHVSGFTQVVSRKVAKKSQRAQRIFYAPFCINLRDFAISLRLCVKLSQTLCVKLSKWEKYSQVQSPVI